MEGKEEGGGGGVVEEEECMEVVSFASSLCDFPFVFEAWRKPLGDIFFDEFFFGVERSAVGVRHWGKIVDRLISKDRNAFSELSQRRVSRSQIVTPSGEVVTLTPSQQESLSRFHQLRRS